MLKSAISLIVFMLFMVVGVAQAQVSITYSSGGQQYFSINIPDNWRVNVGSETPPSQESEGRKEPARLVSAMPGNGVPLWLGLWVPEHLDKIDNAEEFMDSLGLHLLEDVIVTDRKFDTLKSMGIYYVSGTGKKEGEPMDFRAAFLQLSLENVVIAIYIGPRETTINFGQELKQMIDSIQPVTR